MTYQIKIYHQNTTTSASTQLQINQSPNLELNFSQNYHPRKCYANTQQTSPQIKIYHQNTTSASTQLQINQSQPELQTQLLKSIKHTSSSIKNQSERTSTPNSTLNLLITTTSAAAN